MMSLNALLLCFYGYGEFCGRNIHMGSARSHGASATAIGSMIMGVTDTCRTKWVQDPLAATGSANIYYHS